MPPTTPRPSAAAPRQTHPDAHTACAAPRQSKELSHGMGSKKIAG